MDEFDESDEHYCVVTIGRDWDSASMMIQHESQLIFWLELEQATILTEDLTWLKIQRVYLEDKGKKDWPTIAEWQADTGELFFAKGLIENRLLERQLQELLEAWGLGETEQEARPAGWEDVFSDPKIQEAADNLEDPPDASPGVD